MSGKITQTVNNIAYAYTPVANGFVWINGANGVELNSSDAAELGLAADAEDSWPLPTNYGKTNSRAYLSVVSDSCDSKAAGRTIQYNLNGAHGYVWEFLTFQNGATQNNTNGATLNGFLDNISIYGNQAPFTQRFFMSTHLPQPGTKGTPLQIQQVLGGWPVLLDQQAIQRTKNNIYVAGKPCPVEARSH